MQTTRAESLKSYLKKIFEIAEIIVTACPVTSHIYFDACAQDGIFKSSVELPVQCGIASFPHRIVFLPAWEILPFDRFVLVSTAKKTIEWRLSTNLSSLVVGDTAGSYRQRRT